MGLAEKIREFMGFPEDEYEVEEVMVPGEAIQEDRGPSPRDKRRTEPVEVVLVKPERFEDVSAIADHLNENHVVILNLESASLEVSRRMIDFLAGAAYAKDGQIQKIAAESYLVTPYNVDFMSDQLDQWDNKFFF